MKSWNSYKKSQTGKTKAIFTRGESETGRKRQEVQEEQSDRRNKKLEVQAFEVRQAKDY